MSGVLVIGGTAEARALAAALHACDVPVVSSLAGRVSNPALPEGEVRIGGFGGVDGLVDHLRAAGYDAVVDATHPFAARMSAHAATACEVAGVPLLRLQRPGWGGHRDAERWHWVRDIDDARRSAESLGDRAFLTTGRQTLDAFRSWTDRYTLVRLVEEPSWPAPTSWEVLRSRGPYSLDSERELLRSRGIDVLVTKDSGGSMTEAKLQAAGELDIPVVVVRRPPVPEGVMAVDSVDDAVAWTVTLLRS
ncbi:cobalt-precorrin-6A reductase [Epidermidibacterium keratini]|uniref:Cobalt-precorrin-6A reductase n=1 Tax=Epidermidibacterium keratini TaxID=1891644 RepID=A0A7L4YLE0_9ACTN|nr:cobalt-precorrin-6A reductase [Epidermidibacterium keratini]QHB99871.1 cobalt-precorrin-6A reductase [Epidermidibacterium keratini]